uniref:Uncharacterized protein n=1 Tax=Anopheles culicifacies TaxID=139723 RepID=A0A182MR67_9DIPT
MDWRSLPYIPSFGLRTIMALIVESGSNREWHFCHRRLGRKPSKCIVTAGDCLWPNRNHGPVLTSILLVILCLARPIVCSRERELHLPDYAILSRYARTLSNPCDELAGRADSTTKQSAPPEPGTMLTLSELVTQSDDLAKK